MRLAVRIARASQEGRHTEPVDLNEAAREVIALSWSELQRSRVICGRNLPTSSHLSPAIGSASAVILNLLLNATEAMSSVNDRPRQFGDQTERDEGDRVRLTVQDGGGGSRPSRCGQSSSKRSTQPRVAAWGSVCPSVAPLSRVINGRLWAAPNDGPGATFAFSIPRAPDGVTNATVLARSTPAARAAQHVMRNP